MNTRKFPRTMAEAFGPYTNNTLQPIPDKRINWREVLRGLITCAVFVGIGVILAWRG